MAMETSDTTATEVEGAPLAQSSKARALKVAAAASVAALGAGALVAAAVSTGSAASGAALQDSGAAGLSGITLDPLSPGVGCSNWKTLQIKSMVASSIDECAVECSKTVDCVYVNYQDKTIDQCDANGGVQAGFCYLFKTGCSQEASACWQLGTVKRAYPLNPAVTTKPGMGCANWNSIALHTSTQADSLACAALCAATSGCVSMNFQTLSNDQCTPSGEGAGLNTCYLYGGTCVEEKNGCWDLGYMTEPCPTQSVSQTSGTTVAATTTGAAVVTTI